MAKLYSRRGDGGETDAASGRTSKDDIAVEAVGALDETNAAIGAAIAQLATSEPTQPLAQTLRTIQADLFALGAAIAAPSSTITIAPERITWLETQIDATETELAPLRQFLLPGGAPAAVALHIARTVCRRAERRMVSLARTIPLPAVGLAYVNRLSDLIFVVARAANAAANVDDAPWISGR